MHLEFLNVLMKIFELELDFIVNRVNLLEFECKFMFFLMLIWCDDDIVKLFMNRSLNDFSFLFESC